jgi:chemotaxis protein methyltransferase CheR
MTGKEMYKNDEVEPFRTLIQQKTGIIFGEYQYAALNRLLKKRMEQLAQHTISEYVTFLESNCAAAEKEWENLIHAITIKETSWFRNKKDFETLAYTILPQLLQKSKTIRLVSAGCATGEEVYSILIHLWESPYWQPDIQLFFLATDLDLHSLEVAKKGIYPADKLQSVTQKIQAKYFMKLDDNLVQIKPEYRSRVVFLPHNLKVSPLPVSQGLWDVIFCRNVLIYFATEGKSKILENFSSVLADHGYLFLGYSESIEPSSLLFSTVHLHGVYCYQKRRLIGGITLVGTPTPLAIESDGKSKELFLPARVYPAIASYEIALEMIRGNRQVEATKMLQQLIGKDDKICYWLTLGNLYFSCGAFREALEQYELASKQYPLCAEAYTLAGILYYALSHWDMAISSLKKAVFLEPAWSIAHFYLALVYEKQNLSPQAQLHLKQAKQILLQEKNIGLFCSYTKDIADFLCSPHNLLSVIRRKENL